MDQRRPSPLHRLIHTLIRIHLLILISPLAATQKITAGPSAPATIRSTSDYSTGRACAVGCLAYNGVLPCGVAGYQDLGIGLGCGCSPVNGCLCSSDYASFVTSYLNECVSSRCAANVADWSGEATKMLSIYGGYCATANVAVAVTTKTSAKPTASGASTTNDRGPLPAETTAPDGTAQTTGQTGADGAKGGLSQSDVIALAASLGVGIPSLLIAALTLWAQLRKKKGKTQTRPVVKEKVLADDTAHPELES